MKDFDKAVDFIMGDIQNHSELYSNVLEKNGLEFRVILKYDNFKTFEICDSSLNHFLEDGNKVPTEYEIFDRETAKDDLKSCLDYLLTLKQNNWLDNEK